MKKLLLMAVVAVFGFTANAQDDNATGGFDKGDVYISGSLGYNTAKQGDFKANELTFSPSVGYFVSENIALELGLLIGSAEDQIETKTNSIGAELAGRYFFTPSNQFSFTLGAGVAYVNTKVEPNGGSEAKNNTFAIGVAPGVNYFVSDCFALRASIGALSYASSKDDFDGAEAVNSFGLNLDLSDINFGVTYKF